MNKASVFRTSQLFLLILVASQIAFAGEPVRLRTQPLTMTGTYEPAPATQADPTFKSVHIKTKPLTMTGTAQ